MKRFALVLAACGAPPPTPLVRPVPEPTAPVIEDVEKLATVGGVRFVFRAGRMANFLEQIDCLSDMITCSREAFHSRT